MKKTNLVGACLVLSLLASCQQNESLSNMSEDAVLRLRASVYAAGAEARTVTDEMGGTEFSELDALGFFMPEENNPVKWTLTSGQWISESPLTWKDKVNTFQFCAYYPYSEEATTRTSIPMPDLSKQSGSLSEVGDFDFLAARCQTSYQETDNGTVSFTGSSSFKHVYSLLAITLKKDLPEENVLLSQATLEGKNLFGRSTYHFGEQADADGMTYEEGSEKDALAFDYEEPVEVAEESGYTMYFLCNPSDLEENSKFSIVYQRDGVPYTASTEKLGKQFQAGKFYRFTLKLTKEVLQLVGCEVTGWISEELPELAIDEIPVE